MRPSGTSLSIVGRARPDELIAIGLALEEREALGERDRRRLDREIGARALAAGRGDGLAVLRGWLEEAPGAAVRERIERVRAALSLLRWLGLGLGLCLGWSAAAALLQIEVHAGRINIVLCLGLLVLLPLAMTGAGLVASTWRNRRSAAGGVGSGWRGRTLARGAMALLPAAVREDLDVLLGRLAATDRRTARARRALLFAWSQGIGVAFSAGALSAVLAFVVFTDLAFGWSTTLDVDPARVHRGLAAFAAPWARLWPDAVPSRDLVETTRHFRVATEAPHVHLIDPIRYGGWWPFLVMSIAVYGLLPRLLTGLWAARRLGRECARAIALTPGVDRLLDRLATPLVESRAAGVEETLEQAGSGALPLVPLEEWQAGRTGAGLLAIAWAESIDDEALLAGLGSGPSPETALVRVRDAGGRRSLEEDAERVAEAREAEGAVLLCVRAYEPPVLEVLDFLAELRAAIGAERALAVWLLGGRPADRETWRRRLATLGDPGLVAVVAEGAPSLAGRGAAPDAGSGGAAPRSAPGSQPGAAG